MPSLNTALHRHGTTRHGNSSL